MPQIRLEVPCGPEAPGRARDELRSLESLGWIVGDAMLVASELVTNAVLHSGAGPDDRLVMEARVERDRLVISVRDPGDRWGGRLEAAASENPFGGMGLRIVEQLSARWGTEEGPGHHVWAELLLPEPPRAGSR